MGATDIEEKENIMNRRSFLKKMCVAAAGLSCSAVYAMGKAQTLKPNVLFIAIDDMNDWTTLFNRNNPIKTPNLERLARRGVFFSKAFCSTPACNPSRTAIMTGLHATTSGVYGNRDPWRKMLPDAVTLPQYFERHGYATKGAGKIFHHGGSGKSDPANPDFQAFLPKLPTRAPKPNHNGYRTGPLSKTSYDWGEHTQKMIDLDMVEWVENVMDQQWDDPMFLAAGIFKPHLPFYAPPETFKRYPFDEMKLPPMPANDLDDVPPAAVKKAHTEFFVYENTTAQPQNSPGGLRRMVQCYQASADFADRMVGRLIDKLDASGKADNTIIVLWADHGYHLGDKESCVKFTLWEKANRVPFIIVAPGVTKPGTRCDKPVSLLDIYPTLVELAGLPAKADNDGHSLVPLLKDSKRKWPYIPVMTMGKGNHAVRSDRWRYIRYADGSEELYDHSNDPWEWTNLAGKPEYEVIIKQHRKCLPLEK